MLRQEQRSVASRPFEKKKLQTNQQTDGHTASQGSRTSKKILKLIENRHILVAPNWPCFFLLEMRAKYLNYLFIFFGICNFPVTQSVRLSVGRFISQLAGWSVDVSYFPRRAGS